MTEDYTWFTAESGQSQSADSIGRQAAESSLEEVLGARVDLALTTLLNDEVRLALSGRFGPDFARHAFREKATLSDEILHTAAAEARDERIHRSLQPSADDM